MVDPAIKRTIICFWLILTTINTALAANIFEISIEELFDTQIDSVSGFVEKSSEAPAPITIIDQDMIENSGITNLRDLLTLYVPSFTQVQDQNEFNIAFRGIYTSSQQKFLITLNGHRLNSRAYSMANPDHSISLEKIKRIEISRGPGSSIYGNIALTSVVNIVTKTVEETQGFSSHLEIGNHGYQHIFMQNAGINDSFSHYSWLKRLKTDGEAYRVTPQNNYTLEAATEDVLIFLDRFNNKPSIDLGTTLDFNNDLSLLLSFRQGHYQEPLSTGGISGEAYSQEQAVSVNGVSPGAQSKSVHFNIDKQWRLGEDNQFHLKMYYDTNHIQGPVVTNAADVSFVDVAWRDYDYGFKSKWIYNSNDNILLFGIDVEQYRIHYSKAEFGANGINNGELLFDGEPVLRLGEESITSGYTQYKHYLSANWLANVGFRYDLKHRLTGADRKEFSPRAALIYNHENKSIKLSYARAFVDPPYWNRYSKLASFRGSTDLKPEILQSYQLTPTFTLADDKLLAKLNFYYNKYSDVVFRRTTAVADEPLFINAGVMTSYGLEQEWSYQYNDTNFKLIGNHYSVESVELYSADDDEIFNIPRNQYNFIIDNKFNQHLSYQLSLKYLGNRRSPINIALNNQPVVDPFPNAGVDYQVPDNRLSSVLLFNTDIRWQFNQGQTVLTFNVQNLFDKQWTQGGSVVHPYQQTGRWFKFGVEHNW